MMGLMKKAANLTLTGRAAWLLIGTAVGFAAWAGWTQWQFGRLHEKLGRCQGDSTSIQHVATNNATALADCAARLSEAIRSKLVSQQAERAANERLEEEIEARQVLVERERLLRQEVYQRAECSVWANEPVCPDIVDSLHRAAAGARGAGGGDSVPSDPADP